MSWLDSHCHLDDTRVEGGAAAAIGAAKAVGVTRIVTIGTDAAHSAAAVALAAAHPEVWATVGLHPHDATAGVETIVAWLDAPRVVAVGECGLDYHYDHSAREVQRAAFASQVLLARQRDLALVIHTREAWDDTFAILDAEGMPDRVVFHCFTGGPDEARRCLDMGAYLSFSGIVTFKNAQHIRAAAALCPLERMLVETDAPYLAPVPHRGRPNAPALLPVTGAALAAVKDRPVSEIEATTAANGEVAFRLTTT
jgi:TatD DNase family protein